VLILAIHTHYDNLSVAHNAPIEVIDAAKEALLNKYSEKNYPDDAEARRLRSVITSSHLALTDSDRRKAHDAWVKAQQTGSVVSALNANHIDPEPLLQPEFEAQPAPNSTNNDHIYFGVLMTGVAIAGLVLLVFL
jgi:hypothetical protein